MIASNMANQIMNETENCSDPFEANNKFFKAICDYVEANAQVFYAWSGFNPAGIPDPQVVIQTKIITSGSLSPSGATDCSSALAALSSMLNSNASTWTIDFASAGFTLSPAFIIPTIMITPSGANERKAAITHICQEIINGIKAATPVASGAHAAFTGAATFTQIL